MARLLNSVAFIIRRRIGIMGLYHMGRIVSARRPVLSILCYHSFSGGNVYSLSIEEFKAQMQALSQHADFVSLDRVMEIVEGAKLERSAVAITIDDGYRDVLPLVPFTLEHNIPVTLFALSEPEHANRQVLEHNGEILSLKELKELSQKGWTIGCHTATHPDLTTLSRAKLEEEILGSKKRLEEAVGREVAYFAYPSGSYSSEVFEIVKTAGYKAAFSVLPGAIEKGKNPWVLPRTIINRYDRLARDPLLYVKGPSLIGRLFKLLGK